MVYSVEGGHTPRRDVSCWEKLAGGTEENKDALWRKERSDSDGKQWPITIRMKQDVIKFSDIITWIISSKYY
jgi:hypothetical protein